MKKERSLTVAVSAKGLLIWLSAAAVAVGLGVLLWGCATLGRGLEKIETAAERVEAYTERLDRIYGLGVELYRFGKPFFEEKCLDGTFPAATCDRLRVADLKLQEFNAKVEGGLADWKTIMEGLDFIREALQIQIDAIALEESVAPDPG